MSVTLKVKKQPEVVRVVGGGSARKKSLFVQSYSGGEVRTPSYWDGGSKSDWALVRLDLATTPRTAMAGRSPVVWRAPSNHPMFEAGREQGISEIPKGHILVRTGTFCGKPATPTIEGAVEDLARVLAPMVAAGDIAPDSVQKLWPDLLVLIDAELERPGKAADIVRGPVVLSGGFSPAIQEVGERGFPPSCPACGGETALLGELGSATWYRCRDCGFEHMVE